MPKRKLSTQELSEDGASNAKRMKMEEIVDNTEQHATTLLDINLDCLYIIFKSLPQISRIKCALTCRGLLNFYANEFAPSFKKFKRDEVWFTSLLPQAESHLFLKETAHYLEKVDISEHELDADFVKTLLRYGKNIKQVNTQFALKNLPLITTYAKTVQKLNMSYCHTEDDDIKALMQLPRLRTLNLTYNTKLTGQYLASLTNLEALYLSDNHRLEAQHVQQIARSCYKLRLLDISAFPMDVETSRVISKNCRRLQHLWFRDSEEEDYSALAKLPNLRKLTIFEATRRFLDAVAEQHAEHLKVLRIKGTFCRNSFFETINKFKNLKVLFCQFGCHHSEPLEENTLCNLKQLEKLVIIRNKRVRAVTLLQLLNQCTNLNFLGVLGSPYITESFVFSTIDMLKEQATARKLQAKPFQLVVDKKYITNAIFQNKRCVEASSVLQLRRRKRCVEFM